MNNWPRGVGEERGEVMVLDDHWYHVVMKKSVYYV